MKASHRGRETGLGVSVSPEGLETYDPLLFGQKSEKGIVAIEVVEGEQDEVVIFTRHGSETVEKREIFKPFIITDVSAIGDCPVKFDGRFVAGSGVLNLYASFKSWKDCTRASKWMTQKTGQGNSPSGSAFLFLNDPVHQHMMLSGRTMFLGMQFDVIKRMQVDIECMTSPGYEFCNAEREGDRILAIACGDNTGWLEVISGNGMDEKAILQRFVELVRERDPDVMEGHNIFNFDLPYISERAKRYKVKLSLGRDGSIPKRRPSRFNLAERTISYDRYDVFGRHIIDTLFLVQAYDVSHRELDGYGLKESAIHFGLAREGRMYIDGSQITAEFLKNPAKVVEYVSDDIAETRDLSALLSKSIFAQAQILPYSYQNVSVRGNATKIDALMIREYMRQGCALPMPDESREFEGGYTDMFVQGVVENVHHCDVRSLYPSLMLSRKLAPAKDELGVFLKLLDVLRTFRLHAKQKMQDSSSKAERLHLDAIQAAFKILINSFYGYLGFSQGRFSDFSVAEKVTEGGRSLLKSMIKWLQEHGATPVEIDTDGVYFVPPAGMTGKKLEAFRSDFTRSLPDGIDIEFDGEYRTMFSYKMKNYALLTADGDMIVKGAALKSRGLEPFQREFMREAIRLKLEQRDAELPKLKSRFEQEIRGRTWPVSRFAKTENLQDAPSTYVTKRGDGKRARSAVYELALKSGREYRAGDQLSYYVTGDRKSVAVHESAKLVSEWNPEKRDENVAYYIAKLDALYEKFGSDTTQGELF